MNAMEIIRNRSRDYLFGEQTPEGRAEAERLYDMLIEGEDNTYFWPDIDYTDKTRANWQLTEHYTRAIDVLCGFGKDRLSVDSEYVSRMLGVVRYWLNNDFMNPNWWHNDIGAPRGLGDIAIMMQPYIDSEIVSKIANHIMARGSFANRPEIIESWTGANTIWGVETTSKQAILLQDEAIMRLATDVASKEIVIGAEEGVRADGSFYQHGPRLYSGGYGLCYVHDLAELSYLIRGTEYQFSRDKLEIILFCLLDGIMHMMQGEALDYTCVGRNISRKNALGIASLKNTLELLRDNEDMPRREDLVNALNLLNADAKRPATTKYFPETTLLCHHFDDMYVGAKFLNNKTYDAEICNLEGELCYNMSYGTHICIMRSGYEYLNINPIWDYSRVPGTTSRTESDAQLLAHRHWWRLPLPNDCSDGEQKGSRAVIYEFAQHDGVDALVCDFAFEHGFVSLGTNIKDNTEKAEALVTTVDQCFAIEEPVCEDGAYLHNGIRYTPLCDTKINLEVKEQIGAWSRNNFPLSSDAVSGKVLTLTISHKSAAISSYSYMISAAKIPQPSVSVIRNDDKIQAIRLPDGSVMAVFYEAGEISVDGRIIKSEKGIYIE